METIITAILNQPTIDPKFRAVMTGPIQYEQLTAGQQGPSAKAETAERRLVITQATHEPKELTR